MTHAIINAKTLLQKYDIIKILKTRKTIIFLFLCLIISMIECKHSSATEHRYRDKRRKYLEPLRASR